MKSVSIEEHAIHIHRVPIILVLCSIVFVMLMVLDFQLNTLHIVLAILMLAVAIISGFQLSKWLAVRLADHVGSAFEELSRQAEAVLVADRPLEFHSDVAEAVDLSEKMQRLNARTDEVREEMKGLEQVRSQFLANVSHELRTPIFAIQGYLETLLDGAEFDENVRHSFLEKAHNNALRLNVLLGDLIDISRIESGEMRMSFRYFDILDVAKECCATLEGMAKQYGVHLSVHCSETEMSCLGDKERITQVLANLVSNAIRYNRPDGQVSIDLVREANLVSVSVRDNGLGISQEHQQRIFERFYRADANRSRATGGSGLGLAIVKHILEAHETVPEVHSEEQVGTTIRFYLRG